MVHELLIRYNLDKLNIEEMMELMVALTEQITGDLNELEGAIIKEISDGREEVTEGARS